MSDAKPWTATEMEEIHKLATNPTHLRWMATLDLVRANRRADMDALQADFDALRAERDELADKVARLTAYAEYMDAIKRCEAAPLDAPPPTK